MSWGDLFRIVKMGDGWVEVSGPLGISNTFIKLPEGPQSMVMPENFPTGVWVVYFYDSQPIMSSAHRDEIDALRKAVRERADVIFLPFGESLSVEIARQGRENALAGEPFLHTHEYNNHGRCIRPGCSEYSAAYDVDPIPT